MFFQFFDELRAAKLPVTLKEYLALMEALEKSVIAPTPDEFYLLSRTVLVKDEKNLDKFDRVFAHVFRGLEAIDLSILGQVPDEWLRALTEKFLSEEDKAHIESLGGWEKLMEMLQKRLAEQKERHQGGSKMIGTGGTSPFGNSGYHPEGVRLGGAPRHGRAVKLWDRRDYKNLDDCVELGTRNIKVALRRLRKWARTGAATELDLPGTITETAHKGYLDLKLVPERHNSVKVLLFFDIGGSMDSHIRLSEELFSAARSEFKHMDFYYFHNCLYESVWKDNRRRAAERIATFDLLHKYPPDYKVVFIGDAMMSPYEVTMKGGSIEHFNDEAGAVWIDRMAQTYPHLVWLNPVAEKYWDGSSSLQIISQLIAGRMYPLTLAGLENAMRELTR